MTDWPVHGRITGPIVMIGFGSIGHGVLPLIERHFTFDHDRLVVIDPSDKDRALLDARGIRFIQEAVTRENYRELLTPLLTAGGGQGFCVNLSVDTSSLDIMELCRSLGALLHRHRHRTLGRLLLRQEHRARGAHQLRPARDGPGGPPAQVPRRPHGGVVLRRQSRHGLVVRQAGPRSTSPAIIGLSGESRRRREDWARLAQRPRRQGHPHRRARHPARPHPKAERRLRQHLVGRGLSVRRRCSRPSSAGARMSAGCRQTAARTSRLPGRDLSPAAGRQHPRALLVSDARAAIRLPRHAQRGRSRSPTT